MSSSPANAPDWTTAAPKWASIVVLSLMSLGAFSAWLFTRASPPSSPTTDILNINPSSLTSSTSEVPPASPPSRKKSIDLNLRVNINTADQSQLELLPGIGPALAQRIIDDRTKRGVYQRIEDLDRVKGIGPKLLAKLRPNITLQDTP